MKRPKAVVYLEDGQRPIRQEASWAVRWLRRYFSVSIEHDPQTFERKVRAGARLAVVICEALPAPLLPRLKAVRSLAPVILVVPHEARSGLKNHGLWTEDLACIDAEQVPRRLPLEVTISLIDTLLTRSRRAAATLAGPSVDPLVREALKRGFAKPYLFVKAMARSTQRSVRWLELRWAEMLTERDVDGPHLKELLRAIMFLTALPHWLRGKTLKECAAQLGIGYNTLSNNFFHFTDTLPGQVDVDSLPDLVLRLEEDVFGWLLSAEPSGEGTS